MMCRSSIMLGLSADWKQMPMTLPENMHRHANSRARVLVHSEDRFGKASVKFLAWLRQISKCGCFGTNMVTCCVLMGSFLFFKPHQISSLEKCSYSYPTRHSTFLKRHFKPRSNVSFYWQVGLAICSESAGHAIMHSSFRCVKPLILQIFKSCGLRTTFWGNGIFGTQNLNNHFSW